jgi:hypothetical protein
MQRESIGTKYVDIPLPFGATLVDGQTDTVLPSFGGGVAYVAPVAGWLRALSVSNDDAQGAGALTFDVKIGSTQQEINLSSGVADTGVQQVFGDEQYPFAAGAAIGVTYTSGTLTDNGDVSALLIVTLKWD